MSQETKDKRSKANKGKVSPMKGKHLSEETKIKLSEALKGEHNSINTEFKKGHVPWLQGKKNPFSDATIKAISESQKGKHISIENEFKKGNIPWNKGLTKETDDRCRQAGIKVREALKGKKRPDLSKALTGRKLTKEHIKNSLRRRTPSSLEEKFQEIIDKHNLPYRFVGDGSFILGDKNPDFINTNDEKIAIEVYAKYYKLRNNIAIKEWKEERNKVFKEYGWEIIYFDEVETTEQNVLNKLKKEVN